MIIKIDADDLMRMYTLQSLLEKEIKENKFIRQNPHASVKKTSIELFHLIQNLQGSHAFIRGLISQTISKQLEVSFEDERNDEKIKINSQINSRL